MCSECEDQAESQEAEMLREFLYEEEWIDPRLTGEMPWNGTLSTQTLLDLIELPTGTPIMYKYGAHT
jgi:hypothetical protein